MAIGANPLVRWTAPEGQWTEPDLHLFPQDGHRYEIVDGSLHVTPPLHGAHEAVVLALVTLILVGLETWTHPMVHRTGPPPAAHTDLGDAGKS